VAVPDIRVDQLAVLTHSAKKVYTALEFVDIAGLVKGAASGEGLGNKFLANIREADAIVYVLRAFNNGNVVNTQTSVDILRDKEILDTELILKDLETLQKRLGALERESKSGKKEALKELEVAKKVQGLLSAGQILSEMDFSVEEKMILKTLCLLTMKKRLYLINGVEDDFSSEIQNVFNQNNWPYVVIDILTELEAADWNEEERINFGLKAQSGLESLIQKAYEALDLITFLTTGPDETRAWTLKRQQKAPQAGGVIHSDFEEAFIKAEVINWQDLLKVC
ncbi:MAG: DUF933 domain-containing protein, partial [Candidatus Gribaldobacteria bacterium]|nr:DUF933 domain-containing protein [Candidatus Gribaldobacteria bacterium]